MDLLCVLIRYLGVLLAIFAAIFALLCALQYQDEVRYQTWRSRRRQSRLDLTTGLIGCACLFVLGLGLFAASFIPYQGA